MRKVFSLLLVAIFIMGLIPIQNASTYAVDLDQQKYELKSPQTTLHGFSLFYHDSRFMGGPYGFVSFAAGDPVGASFDTDFREDNLRAGEFFDGNIYAYQYDGDTTYSFLVIDAYTYEETMIGNGLTGAVDMAYDYSTNTMFAIQEGSLLTVDLSTGVTTEVGAVGPESMLALACSTEGILYGIGSDSVLYTIDPQTGAGTQIGDTGLAADHLQSMTYDHDTNTLYWARCATAPILLSYYTTNSDLCEVNTETGEATIIGNIYGSKMQLTCLYAIPSFYTPDATYTPESIELNLNEAYMLVGQTAQLSAYIEPVHAPKGVTWVSDNTDVVTVGAGGLLTAHAIGTATVTATTLSGELSESCVVNVITEDDLSSFTLDDALAGEGYDGVCTSTNDANYPYVLDIRDGRIAAQSTMHDSNQYALLAVDAGYLTAGTVFKFDWKVDAAYFVHGFILYVNVPYTANITGQSGWLTYEYVIPESGEYVFTWSFWKDTSTSYQPDCGWIDNVRIETMEPAPASGVTVSPEEVELYEGLTYQLEATVEPMNAEDKTVTWSSSDDSIVTVDENGLITTIAPGTATITATTVDGGFTDTCAVNVLSAAELHGSLSEALNVSGGTLEFLNDLINPWIIDSETYPGRVVARSNIAGMNRTTTTVTYDAGERTANEILSFDWSASSESGTYDYAGFKVNGELIYYTSGDATTFTTHTYTIPEDGAYVFTWEYTKDGSIHSGEDCAWLDNIYWVGEVEYEMGDVNMDGYLNTGDAAAILRYTIGLDVTFNPDYADVNEDGIINTGDAAYLLTMIV